MTQKQFTSTTLWQLAAATAMARQFDTHAGYWLRLGNSALEVVLGLVLVLVPFPLLVDVLLEDPLPGLVLVLVLALVLVDVPGSIVGRVRVGGVMGGPLAWAWPCRASWAVKRR